MAGRFVERFVEANGIRLEWLEWGSRRRLLDIAERTRAGLRDALLVEIPDCSHFPFLERRGS